MKKGFTLIELLAVIVILAIVALIAVPIVLNIINDAKSSSVLRSAEFYLDGVEYTVANAFLYHGGLSNGKYPITESGDICKTSLPCTEENTLKVDVNGEKPEGGFITISSGSISNIELIVDEKTIVKNSLGELIYRASLNDICKLESGTANTIGAKYSCDFGDGTRNFYVLEAGTSTTPVVLILEDNYDDTKQTWCLTGNNNSCNADGLTPKLNEIASAWSKVEVGNVGLPRAEQIMVADGKSADAYTSSSGLTKTWLYNSNFSNLIGYWLLNAKSGSSTEAAFVLKAGAVTSTRVSDSSSCGVRPIVNINL